LAASSTADRVAGVGRDWIDQAEPNLLEAHQVREDEMERAPKHRSGEHPMAGRDGAIEDGVVGPVDQPDELVVGDGRVVGRNLGSGQEIGLGLAQLRKIEDLAGDKADGRVGTGLEGN